MVNTKGAIEMSMTTVVVIVLAMSMLILGLVLIRSIFTGATSSVDLLNDKVKGEIQNLFTEEGTGNLAIKLGADKVAKVGIGTDLFGVGIGAQTESQITAKGRVIYKASVEMTKSTCKTGDVKFITPMDRETAFDEFAGFNAFSIIKFSVAKTALPCTLHVDVLAQDGTGSNPLWVEGSFFDIQVVKPGIFG